MELKKGINMPIRVQQMIRPLSWWLTEGAGAEFILRKGEIGIAEVEGQPPIVKIGDGELVNGQWVGSTWSQLKENFSFERGITDNSLQMAGNITGTLGYYYSHIDFTDDGGKIYLSKTRVEPKIGAGKLDEDFKIIDPPAAKNGKICLVNGGKYDYGSAGCSATIESVENNVITYTGDIGFNAIRIVDSNDLSIDDYTFYIMDQPWNGEIQVRNNIFAIGDNSVGLGLASFASGQDTKAIGNYAHTEGRETVAYYTGHAEGRGTKAIADISHAEGRETEAHGQKSHAEGYKSITFGANSHAEGRETQSQGENSHAEGDNTKSIGKNSHSEGSLTKAREANTHAEGYNTEAIGNTSHAEGKLTTAKGQSSHAEGESTVTGEGAIAAHAEGYESQANGAYSHAGGHGAEANGFKAFAHGGQPTASGESSVAFGTKTVASARNSFAIGGEKNDGSEVIQTTASGVNSFAGGKASTAGSYQSFAFGEEVKSLGINSFAGGWKTEASGGNSFAFGQNSIATGNSSVAMGLQLQATGSREAVFGQYNLPKAAITEDDKKLPGNFIFVVGAGNESRRINAFELDLSGNAHFLGKVYVGSTIRDDTKLVTGLELRKAQEASENYTKAEINKFHSLTGVLFDGKLPETIYYKPIYDDEEHSWQVKDASGNLLKTEDGDPVYDFENLQFVASSSDGAYKLVKLYSYSDEWNNTRYTLNPNYTFHLKADTSAHELSESIEEDKKFLDGLRMEAKYSSSNNSRYSYKDSRGALLAGDHVVANGQRSLVAGQYNFVNGDFASSLGHTNNVRGKNAIAFGYGNVANGHNAAALNEGNKVLGYGSLGYGDNNVVLGTDSIIGGWQNQLRGNYSFVTGARNVAYGEYIGGFGFNNLYNGMYNFGNGSTNTINGNYNSTNGYKNTINGSNNTINGNTNTVNSVGNSIFGSNNIIHEDSSSSNLINGANNEIIPASSYRSLISGYQNKIVSGGGYNLAVGIANNIHSRFGVAIGEGLEVEGYTGAQVVIGRYNVKDTYCQFIVGNGTSAEDRNNIFAVQRDGRATLGADPKYALDAVTKQYVDTIKANFNTEIDNIKDNMVSSGQLPVVTKADAGKVLRVNEKGKWEPSLLEVFEEATF